MRRGEIWHVDLDAIAGGEIRGKRYALIVSTAEFSRVCGLALICPITIGGNFARDAGFAVPLTGAGTATQGVVIVNHVRAMDVSARAGKRVEIAPSFIIDEVLAKLATLFE